jgi:hypothetical protein
MNEIVTYGQGYKLSPGIKVFVKSAKRHCDTLTIIASGLTNDLLEFLHTNHVNVIDAKQLAAKHNVQTSISPYTLKVIYFYLYCKHYTTSTKLYLCDLTDVYIQKNPFSLIHNFNPYVTSENFYITNCETNSTWLNICYNPDIYHLLKKYEVLNGGSILGYTEGVTNLLKEMCLDMTHIISRIGNYQNIDQASLNKVVYFDKHSYNILNNFEIANLAHYGTAAVEMTDPYIKINNKEPHVIHQYDVIKNLENFLYVSNQ